MKGEADLEDKIPCIVFERLRQELGLTFEAISSDLGIPVSTLIGTSSLIPIGRVSRISRIAKYFREIHGLSYVDTDYMLNGGKEDQERIEKVRYDMENKTVEETPFEKYLGAG
jgi:hypothetical protein